MVTKRETDCFSCALSRTLSNRYLVSDFNSFIVVCCVCVGLEVHIRHKHSCNSFSIHPISLGFTKTHAFSIQVGMQRIDNVGGQTLVNQKSENVVAVMSSSL